jgi:predicted TIM-barrel fold metal-dependent hydrolase
MKMPAWQPADSLTFMDRHGIDTAIVILGAPLTSLASSPAALATLCREMNEYCASVCAQHPGRFGFFATLPALDDTDACVAEARHAVEVLGAEGVNVLTSYGDKYLGHDDFQPVWDELERLKTVVFIHPGLETPVQPVTEPRVLPKPLVDWTHETTRTATHLITTDTLKRHPNVKVILPHGGGTLPYIANRVGALGTAFGLFEGEAADGSKKKSVDEFLGEAKGGLYYDMAFAGYCESLRLLLDFADKGHVLYGSDYPFGREEMIVQQLEATRGLLEERGDAAEAESLYGGAAAALFPKFAGERQV